MARMTPRVQDGILALPRDDQVCKLAVGTPAWFAWLAEASAFAFRCPEGSFTARKERAGHGRGGWYWKAYRKRTGRLHRVYLGRSENLTLDRLQAAAAALARVTGQTVAVSPASSAASGSRFCPAAIVFQKKNLTGARRPADRRPSRRGRCPATA